MSFLAGEIQQERTGESELPPASKFQVLFDNVNSMLLRTGTVGLLQSTLVKLKSSFDDSPTIDSDTISEWEKRIPGLKLPAAVHQDTAIAMVRNRINKNISDEVAASPASDGAVGFLGKTVGFVGQSIDPVTTLPALLLTGGASLVGRAFLPEAISSLKFLPELTRPFVGAGIAGSVYGGGSDIVNGEIQNIQERQQTGKFIPTTTLVKQIINDVPRDFAYGATLYGIGRTISKGLDLVKPDIRKADGADVLQDEQTKQSELNLQNLIEKRQSEIEEDKASLRTKVDQIRKNQVESGNAYVRNGDERIDNLSDNNAVAISKAKAVNPEDKILDRLDEENKVIGQSDETHNVKMQAYTGLNEKIRTYSDSHPGIIEDESKDSTDQIDSYYSTLGTAQPNKVVDSAENILNDFRMTDNEDYVNMKKTALAQMENGRDIEVDPYINDAVSRNSVKLINRLEGAGIDREQTIHSALDSLDVVKEQQSNIEGKINDLKDQMKQEQDLDEVNKMRGQLSGLNALLGAKSDQRAVHEVLISALSNAFKDTSQDAVKSYLLNQLSRDAEFKGGYDNLLREAGGDRLLNKLEEKPEAFTKEGKKELVDINKRSGLVNRMVKEAFNCLLGI